MRSEYPRIKTAAIESEHIGLDALLKWAGLAATGGEAKLAVQEGRVRVNGSVELRRSRKLFPGDVVEYTGMTITVTRKGQEAT